LKGERRTGFAVSNSKETFNKKNGKKSLNPLTSLLQKQNSKNQ
jgi:hypothetical protein